jgi:putative phosphoesterase
VKIGILSDTHDHLARIAQAVALFNEEEVGLVLHAGDFASPTTARELRHLRAPLVGVFGNNDGDRLFLTKALAGVGTLHAGPHELEVAGQRAVLMHEPRCLEALVRSGSFRLVVYGHTHAIDVREGSPLVVNPGECGGWLTGRATVVVVDTEGFSPRLIDLA